MVTPLGIIQGKGEATNEGMQLSTGQRGRCIHEDTCWKETVVQGYLGKGRCRGWELKTGKGTRSLLSREARIHAQKGVVNGG